MDFIADTHKNGPNELKKTDFVAVFASLLAVIAAKSRGPCQGAAKSSRSGRTDMSRILGAIAVTREMAGQREPARPTCELRRLARNNNLHAAGATKQPDGQITSG